MTRTALSPRRQIGAIEPTPHDSPSRGGRCRTARRTAPDERSRPSAQCRCRRPARRWRPSRRRPGRRSGEKIGLVRPETEKDGVTEGMRGGRAATRGSSLGCNLGRFLVLDVVALLIDLRQCRAVTSMYRSARCYRAPATIADDAGPLPSRQEWRMMANAVRQGQDRA